MVGDQLDFITLGVLGVSLGSLCRFCFSLLPSRFLITFDFFLINFQTFWAALDRILVLFGALLTLLSALFWRFLSCWNKKAQHIAADSMMLTAHFDPAEKGKWRCELNFQHSSRAVSLALLGDLFRMLLGCMHEKPQNTADKSMKLVALSVPPLGQVILWALRINM